MVAAGFPALRAFESSSSVVVLVHSISRDPDCYDDFLVFGLVKQDLACSINRTDNSCLTKSQHKPWPDLV